MEMKLVKELSGPNHTMEVVLNEEEMRKVYEEYRTKAHFKYWIEDLLEEYGYPPQNDGKLIEMAEQYIDLMENLGFGERLGELEHDAFVYMMDEYYPEIETKEEE